MLLRAFAKINLDLRILGRRPDGYHEVRTILQTIDLADEIHVEAADEFAFVAEGVEGGETNLVVRAVRAFEQVTGKTVAARLKLVKSIPMGAGLGGGSADAAVTFLGLEKWSECVVSESDRTQALRGLGSDVPFFAVGGRAQGVGRGDEVSALPDVADYWVIVVDPGISISTVEAYSWLTLPDKTNTIEGFRTVSVRGSAEEEQRNDFEGAVFARHPRLAEIKSQLLRVGADRASLSGSGSAIFGIFGSETRAESALARLAGYGNARLTRPLSRPEYLRRIWGVAKW